MDAITEFVTVTPLDLAPELEVGEYTQEQVWDRQYLREDYEKFHGLLPRKYRRAYEMPVAARAWADGLIAEAENRIRDDEPDTDY